MSDIDQKTFRSALGEFPTGITIVTAKDSAGEVVGMTANSFSSVSLDPPLILWSVDKGGSLHDAFIGTKYFCVHFLSESQQVLSNTFATSEGDRFEGVRWQMGEFGSPVIADCLATLECVTETIYPGGDHSIILGKVLKCKTNKNAAPLLFHRGGYSILKEGLD